MLKKPFNIFLLIIAVLILAVHVTGYSYLFKGIRLTYLRGENSATINDGHFFSSHDISNGVSKPWEKDFTYNKKPLSSELKKHLEESESVSFLIIKNGKLAQEHYWDNYSMGTSSNVFSMSKTVTTLLLGAAIDDGKLTSPEVKFSSIYPDFANKKYGKKLSLRNLASMEAGLDWDESYKNPFNPNTEAYYGASLANVVFSKGLKENPGEKFEYQSGATQLLGFAIGRSIGIPLATYASIKLWKPLGMEQKAEWTTDDMGVEKAFCCIQSNARDFAKLGLLLLNKGKFENLTLIDEKFINLMTTPTSLSNGVYGLGIWTNYDTKIHHYYLQGILGQYVIVVPEYDVIIVRLGKHKISKSDSKGRPKEVQFYIDEALKILNEN